MINIETLRKDYGNETALIILSCRVHFKKAAFEDLKLFAENNSVDWAKFIDLAKRHRVRSLIYNIINVLDMPQEYKNQIKNQQFELIKRCWKNTIETEKIILLLKQHDILAIPYKGPVLSMQFFGNFVSRETSDIDLTIDTKQLDKAIAILKEIGYKSDYEDIYKYLGVKYYKYFKDLSLDKFNEGSHEFHLELHSAITLKYQQVSPQANLLLYNAGQKMILGKTEIRTMDAATHFSSFLIHHGILDAFKFFRNIVDVSQALNHPSIQMEYKNIVHLFNNLELKKLLIVAEQLSYELFGVTLNKNQRNQNSLSKYFLHKVCRLGLGQHNYLKEAIHGVKKRYLLQEIHWLKSLFSNLLFFISPNSIDFSKFKFHPTFFFLYYFVKPGRSFSKAFAFITRRK